MSAVEPQLRRSRGIALLKPLQDLGESVGHALQLFDSMLWVFRGTTKSNWNLCSAADADVIVVHRAEASERMDEWRKKGKVIVVLSNDAAATAVGDHTLVYPFPAATVLGLLERLDRQLDGPIEPPRPAANQVAVGKDAASSAYELVEAIRTVRAARNAELWVAVSDGAEPLLWLRGDGASYQASPEVRNSIRRGALQIRNFHSGKIASPPAGYITAPGEELGWFAGYYCSGSLAPWLDETARYRLRRWPDFGLLRAPDPLTMACQLRVVAALDAQPSTSGSLVVRARVTRMQSLRALNALSVCGLLEIDTSNQDAKRSQFTPARPEGGFKQFFRGLRQHLRRRSAS